MGIEIMIAADSSWPAARVRRGGLTALWIAERLQSSLTLVLVPSLSLVQQKLAEWGRDSAQDFDTLVVCSDESVVQRNEDTALQSTADLGVKVTTKPAAIRHFLGQRRQRPAVMFAAYQSCDRIAAAQAGTAKQFDLTICDANVESFVFVRRF